MSELSRPIRRVFSVSGIPAITIPLEALQQVNISVGDYVKVSVTENGIFIERVDTKGGDKG